MDEDDGIFVVPSLPSFISLDLPRTERGNWSDKYTHNKEKFVRNDTNSCANEKERDQMIIKRRE